MLAVEAVEAVEAVLLFQSLLNAQAALHSQALLCVSGLVEARWLWHPSCLNLFKSAIATSWLARRHHATTPHL